MNFIYPIKFSFDTNINRDIPSEQLAYMESYFSSFFNTNFTIPKQFNSKYKTIPISYGKITKNPNILAKKLKYYLIDEYKILDSNNTFKDLTDLIVIDLKGNIIRELAINHLISEIDTILQNDIDNANPRFVIIVQDIPGIFIYFKNFKKYIEKGKVLLIDKRKRFLFKENKYLIRKDFSFDNITKTALDKIQFKLIRKIGNFARFKDKKKRNSCL